MWKTVAWAHHLALVCGIKVHAARPPVQLVVVLQATANSFRPSLSHIKSHKPPQSVLVP